MRIAFIGGGVMAEAMLSRAIAEKVASPSDVCVAEPVAARREHLAKTYGIATVDDNLEAAKGAGIVVFAVKPQHFGHAAEPLKGFFPS